ncbi:hypothetical protein [Bacteroides sp.]|uniref:hypothetical protein n=1 Tax=Bacteroides sp. TaxID=29523 RepID=UPI002624F5B0|nr:hypothetical protein [Bacteroides sp.]MDD3040079.1 hypothetical protein [Bacteroides sp.]
MLNIIIPAIELYDESLEMFVNIRERSLQLEHSLVSLSKWEQQWNKPFLTKTKKTPEESTDYIRCMTMTQNVDPEVYKFITNDILEQVSQYIEKTMTATIFSETEKTINKEVITAEVIYYWMIALNIPFECQKWHLDRLLTLINVCNIKNQPKKKVNKKQIIDRNRRLNEQRRQAMNTKG